MGNLTSTQVRIHPIDASAAILARRRSSNRRFRANSVVAANCFDLALLALACVGTFFFRLGSVGLFDHAGASCAEGAREMVETGTYLLPQLNFQVLLGKPILTLWMISGAYHLFGVNAFAASLCSAICGSLLVAVTYFAARGLAGRGAGLISALMLAAAPLMVLFARVCSSEIVFCSFLGTALFSLVAALFLDKKKWLPALYIALGLSVLTDGLRGVLLLLLTGAIYLALVRPVRSELREQFGRLQLAWGIPTLIVISIPWIYSAGSAWIALNGFGLPHFSLAEFCHGLAGPSNYTRAAAALVYGFVPWILFLPAAFKTTVTNQLIKLDRSQRRGMLFIASFIVAVILTLPFSSSSSSSGTSGYILMLMAPFSVLVGALLDQWADKVSALSTPAPWRNFCLFLAIAGPLGALALAVAIKMMLKGVPEPISTLGLAGCAAFWVGMTLQYGLLRSDRVRACVSTVVATVVVCTVLFAPVAFDLTYRCFQQDLHNLVNDTKGRHGQIVMYKSFEPSVMFYLERPVNCVFDEHGLVAAPFSHQPLFIIAKATAGDALSARFPGQIHKLDRKGDWQLLLASHLAISPAVLSAHASGLTPLFKSATTAAPFSAGKPPEHSHFQRWM